MKHIGERIKELRDLKQLSRETLCGDETELSLRQLARIESGQSIPTLPKLLYLAQRLEIGLGELVEGRTVELPKRYTDLKYLLLRTPTYGYPELRKQREEQLEEIAVHFYDNLPEEEQIIIDCIQSSSDVWVSRDTRYGEQLLEEYFDQVLVKSEWTVNDLIILDLYIVTATIRPSSEYYYNDMPRKLILQINHCPMDSLFILNNVIIHYITFLLKTDHSEFIESLINASREIMMRSNDYYKFPIVCLVEWKYALLFLKDFNRAEQCYQDAIASSSAVVNADLMKRLKAEWEKDVKDFRQ